LDRENVENILSHGMSIGRARRVLQAIQPHSPWRSPGDWFEALAALSAVCAKELDAPARKKGLRLCRLVANAAQPGRTQWYFNNLRLLHSLPAHRSGLVGSGTCANEAFHSEMNRWFRYSSEAYSSTLQLQLWMSVLAKLLAHTSALYRPTLRQLRHQDVLARVCASLRCPENSWAAHCGQGCDGARPLAKAALPLRLARQALRVEIRLHKLAQSVRPSRRRALKRTKFTLRRLGHLAPPALRRPVKRRRLSCKTSPGSDGWFLPSSSAP